VEDSDDIRCRVAACPEYLGDGNAWSFYLLNDGAVPLDSVVLTTFGHEWGDVGHAKYPEATVTHVAPGTSSLIWRDNDDELRMWLGLRVLAGDRETELIAEFPLLYSRKDSLGLIAGLGKPGFVVPAVRCGSG
jgi:hypothetical protein